MSRTLPEIRPGDRFGRFVVQEEVGRLESVPTRRRYRVKCDCGSITFAAGPDLHAGRAVRCRKCAITETKRGRDRFVTDRFPNLREEHPPGKTSLPPFVRARRYRLQFGRYEGQTLDDIAADDSGLRYLAWVVGREWLNQVARLNVEAFLGDETIVERLRFASDHEGFLQAGHMTEREP